MSIKNLFTENDKPYQNLNINEISCNNLSSSFSYILQDYQVSDVINTLTPATFVEFTNFDEIPGTLSVSITFNYSKIENKNCLIFVQMDNLASGDNARCVAQVQNILSGSCVIRFQNFTANSNSAGTLAFMVFVITPKE